MQILGFKDWFDNKEKNGIVVKSTKGFIAEKINPFLYKLNPKVLTIHLDNSGTEVIKSGCRIDRFLIDENQSTEILLSKLRKLINSKTLEGNKVFIVGYDNSIENTKRSFKNSKKIIESFKCKLNLDSVKYIPFGNIEKINDKIPGNNRDFNISRIELWIVKENLDIEKEIPFLFNPNDYTLIEKYKTPLRGLLYKLILENNKSSVKISCSKSWPTSKKDQLTTDLLITENLKELTLYNYPTPNKLTTTDPNNKPKPSDNKITVNKLTEKRAESICNFLNEYALNYGITFIPEGVGIKQGESTIGIQLL